MVMVHRHRILLLSAAVILSPTAVSAFSTPSSLQLKRAAPTSSSSVAKSISTGWSSSLFGANGADADDESAPTNAVLKANLLKRIEALRTIKERDGDIPIDFGVKGGEIDKKSRAPQKVNYYSISDDAGKAADAIMQTANELSNVNPTEDATLYLGDKEKGDQSPLNGEWKLLFTTAADATFSKNSTRGDAKVKNVVDAKRGRVTNVVDFALTPNGTEPLLKQLNVVIAAVPVGKSRVELRFRYARVVLTKFFGWKKQWSLYIPVPAPFITRLIVFFSRVVKFWKRDAEKKVPPKAYFDVVYLDEDLRIHRTGEDNLFVQAKDGWVEARPYLA